jgi:tetratricopeptide (TPR) repeat protein
MRLIDEVLLAHQHHAPSRAWFQLTKALVEYRAGNTAACLEWTIKSRANNPKVTFGDRRYPQGTALALAAMAHHRLGHSDEARQALAEANRLMAEAPQPGERDLGAGQENWQVWAVLLREAQDLIGGGGSPVPPAPGPGLPAAPAPAPAGDPDAERIGAAQVEMLEAEVARLTGEMKALPNDPKPPTERAIRYGHLGRFRESLADLELALKLDPDHCDARFSAAVARLYLNDVEGYRAQARDMMRRFAGRGDSGVKERVGKTFLLSPPPDSEADVAAARRLVDEALELPHADDVAPYTEMAKALAEYRAGRFEACLEWVGRSRDHQAVFGDRRKLDGTCLALAAMAQHRLGRGREAVASLDASQRLLDESPEPGKADLGIGPNNREIWEIVLREARSVLGAAAGSTTATRGGGKRE